MHPEILSIALFWFVTAYTPGPNNVVASYSGFNFGITKTIPHILGVTLGFTSLVIFLTIGLINVFKLFPIIQVVIKYLGTLFLIYLAYKIATSTNSDETKKENPVKFTKKEHIENVNQDIKKDKFSNIKRCPNGTRKNKQTGECEKVNDSKQTTNQTTNQTTYKTTNKLPRCPNGMRRNPKTKACEPKS